MFRAELYQAALILSLCSQSTAREESDFMRMAAMNETYGIFHHWMSDFNKTYDSLITAWTRFIIFKENMARAWELNVKHGGRATFGWTQFADLTPGEFLSDYLTTNVDSMRNPFFQNLDANKIKLQNTGNIAPPPASFDWTEQGVITSVKQQGRFGTCYIFAALAVIESRWARKGNGLVSLSVEQVADCLAVFSGSDNVACGVNGGLQTAVYRYVKDVGGIAAERDYPYKVGSGEARPCPPKGYSSKICGSYPIKKCRVSDSCDAKFDKSKFVPGMKVKSWSYVPQNEAEIVNHLLTDGPLSTALDAVDLQLYQGGILTPGNCQSSRINHAVVLVGYGQERGAEYWKVKNSWGYRFGESGYFKIARGIGACGINKIVTTVDLE